MRITKSLHIAIVIEMLIGILLMIDFVSVNNLTEVKNVFQFNLAVGLIILGNVLIMVSILAGPRKGRSKAASEYQDIFEKNKQILDKQKPLVVLSESERQAESDRFEVLSILNIGFLHKVDVPGDYADQAKVAGMKGDATALERLEKIEQKEKGVVYFEDYLRSIVKQEGKAPKDITYGMDDVVPEKRRSRMIKRILIPLIAAALLGIWMFQSVNTTEEHTYLAVSGDHILKVASRLNVLEEDLIEINREKYPTIEDGKIKAGWRLVYYTGGVLPRWKIWLQELKETEFGSSFVEWVEGRFESLQGLVSDDVPETLEYENYLAADGTLWSLNQLRRSNRLNELTPMDEKLQVLAMERAAICAGQSNDVFSDHPLCEGCIEIVTSTFGYDAERITWEERYLEILLGDYDLIGIGAARASDDSESPACTITILKEIEGSIENIL